MHNGFLPTLTVSSHQALPTWWVAARTTASVALAAPHGRSRMATLRSPTASASRGGRIAIVVLTVRSVQAASLLFALSVCVTQVRFVLPGGGHGVFFFFPSMCSFLFGAAGFRCSPQTQLLSTSEQPTTFAACKCGVRPGWCSRLPLPPLSLRMPFLLLFCVSLEFHAPCSLVCGARGVRGDAATPGVVPRLHRR
jgi:hypothetical protein